MKTIWKTQIIPDDYIELFLPKGAKPLSVQVQNDEPLLWLLCDQDAVYEQRTFRLVATGEIVKDENLEFIGTFQLSGGSLVFHLFEVKA